MGMGSAGFQPVGAGILPATRPRVGVHGPVTCPRAIRSRQDAGSCGQDGRAPPLPTASLRLPMNLPQPRVIPSGVINDLSLDLRAAKPVS